MSHFLDRLTFFTRAKAEFAGGHGITTSEDRSWGGWLSQALQHEKIRSLHARRQLYGLLLVESLRQRRHRYLGNPADRLSADAT